MEQKNAILIVLDGLGDLPIPELGNKTPLQAATKPNLDAIASKGACGIMDITGSGEAVESDVAHLILFGYDPVAEYPGRGLLEALGVGMELSNGDIAFRGNLACLDANNIILDRRAGRNIPEAEEFVKAVNGISLDAYPGVRMDVVHSTEQRLAVVIRGPGLSASISMVNEGRTGVPASECNPVGSSPAAINTAKIINLLMKKARGILDKHPLNEVRAKKGLPVVNAVLLYGPGSKTTVSSLKEKYKIDVACIAGNGLIKGLCKYLGMTLVPCKGATGTAATDLNAKVEAVISTYKKYDLTFLHVKATDAFGHDKKPVQKKEFIEKFDRALGKLLEKIDLAKTFLFITGDHATPCALGSHSGDPVPIVMAGPTVIRDDVTRFDEASCARGYLSRISGKYVISLILNKLDKLRKFGA